MKDLNQVLEQKEKELKRLDTEVYALRIVKDLLREDAEERPQPTEAPPSDKFKKQWP
jgi:hypothetical protein